MIKNLEKFTNFNAILLVVSCLLATFYGLGCLILDAFNDQKWLSLAICCYLALNLVACLIVVVHYLRKNRK